MIVRLSTRPLVAIVGGGFTGAAIAYHLARFTREHSADVLIVEPHEHVGAGLAYSSNDPAHRINVPAARMSIDPDDDTHFENWIDNENALASDPAATTVDGRRFPRRNVFGRYVNEQVSPLLQAPWLKHIRARVTNILREHERYLLYLSDGRRVLADFLVLAVCHPAPSSPRPLDELLGHPRFIADTTVDGALSPIRSNDAVLIVGTGLTMADSVASLDARGHKGPIIAISRRGQRSRGHAPVNAPARGDFVSEPARTALQLLRNVRAAVRDAAREGVTWHPVFDALRTQGQSIWKALPPSERLRFIRHIKAYWDAHRFRVAPQVQAVLDRRLTEGTLEILAASVAGAEPSGDGFRVQLRERRTGKTREQQFDTVVITTGPAHSISISSDPLLSSLVREGLVRADPTGLGLETDSEGHAIGVDGLRNSTLLIAGPLARGTFGELMGLPEVTRYAAFIAARVTDWINSAAQQTAERQQPVRGVQ